MLDCWTRRQRILETGLLKIVSPKYLSRIFLCQRFVIKTLTVMLSKELMLTSLHKTSFHFEKTRLPRARGVFL